MAEDAILARGWTFEVNAGAGFVAIGGVDSFTLGQALNKADTTRFSSAGQKRHLPASREKTLTLGGHFLEDTATGGRDAGQAAVETVAELVGAAGVVPWKITSPGGTVGSFNGSAKLQDVGGGNDDPTSWGVEITVDGQITWA